MRLTIAVVLSFIAASTAAAQDPQGAPAPEQAAQQDPAAEQAPAEQASAEQAPVDQTTAVPTPPRPAGPPLDVVLTLDGGMVRGTIIESVPSQYVVITLPTGETRRFEWSTVRYAGPAGGAPRPTVSAPASSSIATPPPEPSGVQVRFESPQEGVAFHRVTGTATGTGVGASVRGGAIVMSMRAHSFERLCTAPCELTLDPGEYELALSVGRGTEVVANVIDVARGGTVTGQYLDRSGLRIAGWLTFGVGIAGGLGLMFVPLALPGFDTGNVDIVPWMVAGIAVAGVATIIGLILTLQGDGAVVRFD